MFSLVGTQLGAERVSRRGHHERPEGRDISGLTPCLHHAPGRSN